MTPKDYTALRERLGWTQQELADYVGRHVSIISRRERGEKPVTREAELAILLALATEGGFRYSNALKEWLPHYEPPQEPEEDV